MKFFTKKKTDHQAKKPLTQTPPVTAGKKVMTAPKPAEAKKADKKSDATIKGKSAMAYNVLVQPLITEKATELGAFNKYVFAVNPAMNKIEVKKAIRTIYHVDPQRVNILNFSGKQVRSGKVSGETKKWKKAIRKIKSAAYLKIACTPDAPVAINKNYR